MDPKDAKMRRRSAKANFTRSGNALLYMMKETRSEAEVRESLGKLENSFKVLELRHEEYANLLEDDEFEEEEAAMEELQRRFLDMTVGAKDYLSSHEPEGDAEAMSETDFVGVAAHRDAGVAARRDTGSRASLRGISSDPPAPKAETDHGTAKEVSEFVTHGKVKVSKPSLPTFSGDVREYFEFRSDFKHLIEKSYCKRDAVTMLRSALIGKPLEIVRGLGHDYDGLWETLDSAYGDPRFIADAVTNDIVRFKSLQEGEDARFCELVQLVRRCYNLLNEVGRPQDMDNNYVIALLEQKLSNEDKKIWCRHLECEGRIASLSNLLEWMSVEMRTRMRSTSAVRCTTTRKAVNQVSVNQSATVRQFKCWLCSSNSHFVDQCAQFQSKSVKERYEVVKGNNACFSCLKRAGRNHRADTCNRKQACSELLASGAPCSKWHHKLLHFEKPAGQPVHVGMAAATGPAQESILPIATVSVIGNGTCRRPANVFFDQGSQVSLIRNSLATEMKLTTSRKIAITIVKLGNEEQTLMANVYDVRLQSAKDNRTHVIKAVGIDSINDSHSPHVDTRELATFLKVEGTIPYRKQQPIDILVGVDHASLQTGETVERGNLVARNTPFGWVFFGGPNESNEPFSTVMHVTVANRQVDLTDFWTTETMGVSCGHGASAHCETGLTDQPNVIDLNCKKVDNRWTMSYPWIRDPNDLPNNRAQAEKLLYAKEKQLMKNVDLAEAYSKQIQDMVKMKFARKLQSDEMSNYKGPVFYLPHHAIVKESSSTPVRVVFNSSIKFQGHCLNDYWDKGPDLFNDLIGVLLRFRERQFALVGDISKMYHQIGISERDQHVHRFLWRDMNVSTNPDDYVMNVLTFGDKPAPSMALTALRKAAEEVIEELPSAAEAVLKNSYMDDICDSTETEEEALDLTKDIDKLLENSGFRIKKWSVSRTLDSTCNSDDLRKSEKVLGMSWDRDADELSTCTKDTIENETIDRLTKRSVLSKVSKLFDPLGLVAAVVVRAKMALQGLWKKKYDWDDPLDSEDTRTWTEILKEIERLSFIRFPRSLTPSLHANEAPMLCVFADASEDAFGACAYIRWKISDGEYECRLICSKSRVAPLKKLTIPKLELQAAVLAARLKDTVMKELRIKFGDYVMFTDSMIAMGWILNKSNKVLPFVSCRVQEIADKTSIAQWKHIPGQLNVADQVSRGIRVSELDETWKHGPSFLRLPREQWPVYRDVTQAEAAPLAVSSVLIGPSSADSDRDDTDTVIAPHEQILQNVSSWTKAKRTMAYVLRFISNCRSEDKQKGPLTVEETTTAETRLIKESQNKLLIKVRKGELKSLSPFVAEDGLLRVGGRMNNAEFMSYDNKHPILLSGNDPISRLITVETHELGHNGVAATVAKVRRKFWICKVHNLAKSIVRHCVLCKKLAHRVQSQIMAPLPKERLQPCTPPFFQTSIDYFGPFAVKVGRGVKTDKHYGVLFTCLNTRAVHLELATNASSDELLMVLRRFLAIRGFPSLILSDNGTQMVGAEKHVVQNWNKQQVREFCSVKGIVWKFTTPLAPHHNGCTESLVKTSKRALKVIIGEQKLTAFELFTYLAECGNIINQRPIGRIPNDPSDGRYICPNDILLGRSGSYVPDGNFRQKASVTDRVNFVQQLIDNFWKRWSRDVLPTLFPRKKWCEEKKDVCEGDLVVVAEPNSLRGKWSLGRIEETYKGSDNRVRNAKIKIGSTTIRRPITKFAVVMNC